MSHYTTQVRWIVENATPGFTGSIRSRITTAAPSIFNFDFPIFQENHRIELETKILSHYYMKEIGFETVGLWKMYLETRLNEIMPYYNELYAIEANKFDYLADIDVTDVYKGTEDATYNEDTTSNTDTTGKQVYEGNQTSTTSSKTIDTENQSTSSETKTIDTAFPQAQLSDLDYASEGSNSTGTITSENTANGTTDTDVTQGITSTTDNTATTDATGNKKSTNNIDRGHTLNRKGKAGNKSYTELMLEYRNAIINIDMLIIENLHDLFMAIY